MTLLSLLNQGGRSLRYAGVGVATAADNVANANTTGYTRQSVTATPAGSIRRGGLLMGRGISTPKVLSAYDRFSQDGVFSRQGEAGYADTRAGYLGSLDTTFTEGQLGSLGQSISAFFDSFSLLEGDPTSVGLRIGVLAEGERLSELFRYQSEAMTTQAEQIDAQLSRDVTTLNGDLQLIAELNDQIVQLEGAGGSANDLRARRTGALEDVASYGPLRVVEQPEGAVDLLLGGHALVQDGRWRALSVITDPSSGQPAVHVQSGTGTMDVTASFTSGTLAARIEQRSVTLPGLQGQLDELAFAVQQQVNVQHQAGFGTDGVGARDFFDPAAAARGAAASMALSLDVDGDPSAVAASGDPALPGDNSNATALLGLSDVLAVGGVDTFSSAHAEFISGLGEQARSAFWDQETSDLRLQSARDLRDGASGVALEEEALDLIRYQDAYQAAGRVLGVVQDLLDELLNMF